MKFGALEYFWFFLAIPVLVGFYFYAFRKKRKALERFAHIEMLKKLVGRISKRRQSLKAFLMILAVFFAVITLTRPQYGTKMELMKRKGIDVVIAVDVSLSMYAEDIKPNRLERAKHEIASFIDKLRGDRVGLVAFAGEAFLQCPLTLDYSAAKIFLEVLGPGLIGTPGTAIGSAIEKGLSAFDPTERKYRVLVLLTDGEDHSGKAEKWADEAAKQGVTIYTVGIGSVSGVPIPIKDNVGNISYKKDRRGNVVSTKLDELTLQKIALTTNGKYFHAAPGRFQLEEVVEEINQMEKREMEGERFTQFEDRFQYPLAVTIFLVIIEMLISDRRKVKKKWTGRFS
ncbi:MAG: VWA domain-containing protein [Fibrobacteria bacterium]|nr:VWA domain-containing protein [Fibrobacteria bacterium]